MKLLKEKLLAFAEVTDALRLFPRLLVIIAIISYGVFFVDQVEWVKEIYKSTKEIPTSVAAFSGVTISSLGGIVTLLINKYFSTGRNWMGKDV